MDRVDFVKELEALPEISDSLHDVINKLKAELEGERRDNETLRNMCKTCPYAKNNLLTT